MKAIVYDRQQGANIFVDALDPQAVIVAQLELLDRIAGALEKLTVKKKTRRKK